MKFSRILCTLSGDDYSIISLCNKSIQNRFMAIGGFVSTIFALCFVSCYFTFTKLFQNFIIGIPIGIFFAYMITNIYLLLLYTLSINSFPCNIDKAAQLFSIAMRIIFIGFIAIVVSKPIETILYSGSLEREIEIYRQEQIDKYTKSTIEYFDTETKNLKLIIEKQKSVYSNAGFYQVENYEKLLQKKEIQRSELINSMTNLVHNSNYFIQSIVILNTKYLTCWFLTFITVVVFLFPAYLKIFLGDQSSFYETKRTIENRLVNEEYASFKTRYNLLFQDQFKISINFSESFIDAPYNTIRKRDEREFLKEDDLISDLYNA
jgi:hypothetical protein